MREKMVMEYEIMQNTALGANALYAFANGFYSETKDVDKSITLWHLICVLPLVYQKKSRKIIIKRRVSSGLRSILDKDTQSSLAQNEVVFNINGRIKNMKHRTFRSLNMAIACKILKIEQGYIYTLPYNIPQKTSGETKEILDAASKLGKWAGNLSDFEYLTILGVEPLQ
ncbi:three component ABC system middle component [Marinilactibacillus sp. XAAS-LB27]|uniref:three component ABC system middle component n=1 Tax=Marinilactibacillus sp. XAAS-LB27 TaxID=3114538 RepID=UPI002E17EBDC|nr:three component ABC system middle component [Marinilactibacillus sp. XAAS-LB27]